MDRMYLLVFTSPALQPEHAEVIRALERESGGNMVEVFKQANSLPGAKGRGEPIPFTAAYLFTSPNPPSEVGFPAMNGDRFLLIAIREPTAFWAHGLSVARAWLDRQEAARTRG
jgi:hypothetical protein